MKFHWLTTCLFCGFWLAGLTAATGEATAAEAASVPPNFATMAAEFSASLRAEILDKWFPASIDRENGGYWQDFDAQWRRSATETPKGIVMQARLLWLSSQAARRFPQTRAYADAAAHGFAFLRDQCWDPESGGWFWSFDAAGHPQGQFGTEKHVYGMSFGIYACAAYYQFSQAPEALTLAQAAFRLLEKKARDPLNGGYHESFTRDWTKREQDSALAQSCPVGCWPGVKTMNTHIHLLESFTALYEIWPDPQVAKRIEELLNLICDKIQTPPGGLNQYFTADWRVLPAAESFGHDIETTYLIFEALAGLKASVPGQRQIAKNLAVHAIQFGYDRQAGGLADLGDAFGGIFAKKQRGQFADPKVAWVQAECLNTLLLLAEEYPSERAEYLGQFLAQWAFIKSNLLDPRYGGWYPHVPRDGDAPGLPKSGFWLGGYHTGRAMMNCLDRLPRLALKSALR